MSGRGSTVSERYRPTTNEKPSETMFQRVLLDFVLKTFGLGAENEPRARIRGRFSRNIFTPPTPERGEWGRSWRISFSAPSKASLIKGRFGGIVYMVADSSAKRTKKAIIFRLSLCVERKTRVYPSAPHSVYQAFAFAQYYTPNSRDTWVVSRCRFRVRLLPYKLQNYSCLRQIYE